MLGTFFAQPINNGLRCALQFPPLAQSVRLISLHPRSAHHESRALGVLIDSTSRSLCAGGARVDSIRSTAPIEGHDSAP